MTAYYISMQTDNRRYGYSIRDGRNSTIAWCSTRLKQDEAKRRALARVEQLISRDKLFGISSWIAQRP